MDKETFRHLFSGFLKTLKPDKQIDSIPDDENLWDLGLLDSLTMVDLMVFLEEQVGVQLEVERLSPDVFHTVSGIYSAVVSSGAAEPSA